MPGNAQEAVESIDDITAGNNVKKWGVSVMWPAERMEAGDWTPVQWFDVKLAADTAELEQSPLLEPAGLWHSIGPAGQRIDDAFEECDKEDSGATLIFDSISSKLRRTIHGKPEAWHHPKPTATGKRLGEKYWAQRSNLLVSQRFDTISGRLTALYSDEATVGKGWVPVSIRDESTAKALTVWWNTTPARLMLLNRRGKKLTYPKWSLAHMKEIRIPKSDNPGWQALRKAYDKVCEMELLPMKDQADDEARRIIDEAAAKCLNLDASVIASWRERLAREPTITNRPVV